MFVPIWMIVVAGGVAVSVACALWLLVRIALRATVALNARTARLENAVQGLIIAHQKHAEHDELISALSPNSPAGGMSSTIVERLEEFTRGFLGH
jgi:hypothetical protein